MTDAVTLSAASFGVVETFLHADWVVKGVMLGLASASLWSWAVIIEKTFRIGAAQREADRFEGEVAEGRSLDELAKAAGDAPRHALPIMLQTALREWRDARGKAQLTETQTNLVILRVDRALEGVVTRETGRLENGLGVLAIVATSSPFIGLFGTVWGIMTAFQAIAVQKNTNLTVVAPSIAQALFATAIGLAAAIPAYIAYNKFSGDVAKFTDRLEAFADDLAVAVARRLGDKAGS
ncbi:MAG: protein TolQ [Pseudomonadota bacterium]|jgi:biopolymer transport protein TolQ